MKSRRNLPRKDTRSGTEFYPGSVPGTAKIFWEVGKKFYLNLSRVAVFVVAALFGAVAIALRPVNLGVSRDISVGEITRDRSSGLLGVYQFPEDY